MASTLYIQLPSKALAHSVPDWKNLAFSYASVSGDGKVLDNGSKPWADLQSELSGPKHVALILAAADVTLLEAMVPVMPAAKLKAALPNLLEDQLIGDVSEMSLQSSPVVGGTCTVAVAETAWLETVSVAAYALGANKVVAYPAQMLAQPEPDATTVLVEPEQGGATLIIRPQNQIAFAVSLNAESPEALNAEIIQAISLFVPDAQMTIYVAPEQFEQFQSQLGEADCASRVELFSLTWNARIAGLNATTLDLLRSLSTASNSTINWRAWRWPLGLAAVALLINVVALNTEWIRLKREADALSQALTRTYRAAFPQDNVVLDPLLQMRQQIAASKKFAGQSTPDDFAVLASQFASVWDGLAQGDPATHGISSFEYRDRSLFVKPKKSDAVSVDALRRALQTKALALTVSKDGVFQIKPEAEKSKK
jgi:general secretion pathway protein L